MWPEEMLSRIHDTGMQAYWHKLVGARVCAPLQDFLLIWVVVGGGRLHHRFSLGEEAASKFFLGEEAASQVLPWVGKLTHSLPRASKTDRF